MCMDPNMLRFIFHGLLGGVLWLLMNWQWTKKAIVQHTIVSAIVGYLYYLLYVEYNFPNGLMSIVSGYMGVDFVKHLVDFFGRKVFEEGEKEKDGGKNA